MEYEKMKNKRLISWSYIWRFLILSAVYLISNMLVSKLIGMKIEEIITKSNINIGEAFINSANASIANLVISCLIFSLVFILGWKVIHKKVSKKITIEKQNEKYVLKSINIVTGIVMLCVVWINFISEPIQNTFGLGAAMTLSETRESIYEAVNQQKDMQDLIEQGLMPIADSTEETLRMFDFDVEQVVSVLEKALIFSWIIACIVIMEVIYLLIKNSKKIKNMVIENSLDVDGNIILTQEKMKKKYKNILIIVHIIMLLVVIGTIAYKYHQKHKYDWYYEMVNNNQHEKITDFKRYDEIPLSREKEDTIDEFSGDEIINEENMKQLEHEREWYLNNFITPYEAMAYKMTYIEHRVDKNYAESMYDELEKIISELNEYLEKNDEKDLYTIEKEFNMKFLHIGMDEYVHIIDNKNLITGVGIKAYVDNFTDRNVLSLEIWDIDDVISKVKEEREKAKLNITMENIEDKLPLIYADMKIEDVIEVLGNAYLYEKHYNFASEWYTWYDKNDNYIEFSFRDGEIKSVCFYKK